MISVVCVLALAVDLPTPPMQPLPLGAIEPRGWLRDQLRLQADGLSGHLDEFWPDIKDSAWFGGNAEGWERVPYWLDGLVPLAYLLDDAVLKAKVTKAIDTILERQHGDGWLGPIGDNDPRHKPYDVWPLFPLFKALAQYHEASGDPRVVPAMMRCARKIDEVITREPLYAWARFRAADLVVSLLWLHEKTGEAWLLDLARKAFGQSHDWRAQFEDFRYTERVVEHTNLATHGVNTGMALKYGPVRWRLTGDPGDLGTTRRMLEELDRYHGQATGLFSCDEHLAGRSPSQGSELCTVVEAMYALSLAAAATGDVALADRLERLAYNALPATFTKDMRAHQYDQQVNQVICTREGEHVYATNGGDANLFGLEPNFGCCTANFHQGWPKFVSHLWMRTADGGLAAVAYAPCVVKTTVGEIPVRVEVATGYPFRDEVRVAVTVDRPVRFPLRLRLPGWSRGVEIDVDGDRVVEPGGSYHRLEREWSGTTALTIRFENPVELYEGFQGAVAVRRGPLVYARPIAARWEKVVDRPGLDYDDWEVYPTEPWAYALEIDRGQPAASVEFEERPIGSRPFSPEGAAVVARVKGRRLPNWVIEKSAAAPPPPSPVTSDAPLETLTLIPYGATDLRVTEFPTLP
ncbi:MAG: hypothetical protein KatS3mg108_2465 [Isosphaeraceae bacterium]|jgi:DUF1680 family protein|nr:MAG: hypothetical protein KatS3mg108_2465 [Isosphaeraceae bacterium]